MHEVSHRSWPATPGFSRRPGLATIARRLGGQQRVRFATGGLAVSGLVALMWTVSPDPDPRRRVETGLPRPTPTTAFRPSAMPLSPLIPATVDQQPADSPPEAPGPGRDDASAGTTPGARSLGTGLRGPVTPAEAGGAAAPAGGVSAAAPGAGSPAGRGGAGPAAGSAPAPGAAQTRSPAPAPAPAPASQPERPSSSRGDRRSDTAVASSGPGATAASPPTSSQRGEPAPASARPSVSLSTATTDAPQPPATPISPAASVSIPAPTCAYANVLGPAPCQ